MSDRSSEYDAYLNSPSWADLKRELWSERPRACMVCQSKRRVEAHHLIYRDPIASGTTDDLMPLCHACHKTTHANLQLIADCHALPTNDLRRAEVIRVLMLADPSGAITPAGRRFRRRLNRIRSRKHRPRTADTPSYSTPGFTPTPRKPPKAAVISISERRQNHLNRKSIQYTDNGLNYRQPFSY